MNRKRIIRSPWLWGLVILFAIFVLPSMISSGSGYHGVATSDALGQVQAGNVTKATMDTKDQLLQQRAKRKLAATEATHCQNHSQYVTRVFFATGSPCRSCFRTSCAALPSCICCFPFCNR